MVSRVIAAALMGAACLSATAGAGVAHASVVLAVDSISIRMTPASPRAGSEVRLTAGTAPEGAAWAWDLDGDGAFDDATGPEAVARFGAGTHTVRAQAPAGGGELITDARTFTAHDFNVAPAGSVEVAPGTARAGVPVTVTAKGSDADGPAPAVALDLDGDGSFETEGPTASATFAVPGDRTIRARFTDDAGATSVSTTTLDVHAGNLPPTVQLYIPAMPLAAAQTSESTGILASAEDADGRITRYEYDLDGDGTYETDGGTSRYAPARPSGPVLGVRVTDDGGATATYRTSQFSSGGQYLDAPPLAEVGRPVTLRSWEAGAAWDADGDGDFDDGTGATLTFTYPAAGTYEPRVRVGARVGVATISVRDAAGLPAPRFTAFTLPLAKPGASRSVVAAASGVEDEPVDRSFDLDGDGQLDDQPGQDGRWTFAGPTTVTARATDVRGRTATVSGQVPIVDGNLDPDAGISVGKGEPQSLRLAASTYAMPYVADQDDDGCCAIRWDVNGADQGGDGRITGAELPAGATRSVALHVTDAAGATTTVGRTVGPPPATGEAIGGVVRQPRFAIHPRVTRVRLATLLRRGIVVKVPCPERCRTTVAATVAKATAKRLKLRSREIGRAKGTGQSVRVKLTARARKALRHARSVKLTLTVTSTGASGARATASRTLTIRR